MANAKLPNVPYIQAFYQGKKHKPRIIEIRVSDTTSMQGAALGIANNWHSKTSPHESGHYVVDEALVYRCTPDDRVAGHWHCSDPGVLRVTMCGEPAMTNLWERNESYKRAMDRTADLVAQLCLAHNIPVWEVTKKRFCKPKGIRDDILGVWPLSSFIDNVQRKVDERKK